MSLLVERHQMSKIDDILNQARQLLPEAMEFQVGRSKQKDLSMLNAAYQSWYTRALAVVRQITPERAVDFAEAYKLDRRKEITYDTYTISDYLMGLRISRGGRPTFDADQAYSAKLVRQSSILNAAINVAPSALHDIRAVMRAELMDSDIAGAKELAKAGHLRSAGVVCGVVLEKHLKETAARHEIKFRKKNVTISDANDALKENSVYDVPMWRLVQRLADIRNLCAHSKERDPKKDEVEDLIAGTEKVIKEVF
jgi:hypothetical protein